MSENIISIPVLFDIGGDAIVFGEETPDDFVNSHLDFVLDMTTEANDISLNAADISSAILIGDNDTDDNIFYSGGSSDNIAVDNLCNRIAKAITRGKLVHLPKSGDHSNSGIPMGGRQQLANNLGELGSSYATKYMTSIAPIGDEQMLGQAMARVASIHLVGSPLAAGIFEDQNQIQTDLETASAQTFNSGNTAFYNALAVQLSKVLGGSKSSAPMNNGSGGGSGGSNSDLASQIYYESFDNEDVTLESTHDTVYVTGRSGSGKALSTIGQTVAGLQWIQKTTDSTLSTDVIGVSFFMKFDTDVADTFIFDNRDNTDSKRNFYIGNAPNSGAGLQFQTPTNTNHLPDIYYNGTLQTLSANASTHSVGNINKLTLQDGNWHHFYLEYPSDAKPTSFTWFTRKDTGSYGVNASLDDLRYFDAALTTTQIQSLAAGGSGGATTSSGGYPLDASGTSVPALKSIYEQLMNVPGRSQIMQTRDISGVRDNSNVTLAGGFPFISGDKLVMYLRPKVVFANQTRAQQSTTLVGFSKGVTLNTPVFNVGRSGQGITGQTYSHSSLYAGQYGADKAFDGTVSGGYGYIGGGNFDNNTGAYNKTPPDNTSVDGSNLAGEWIQVNVGKKVAVTSYKIYPQNWEKRSIGGRSPHIFKLVYSDDGTNFLTADSQTVGTDNLDTSEWATTNDNGATYIPKTFTLTNTKVGQYWRLIITSLYGNGYSNGGTACIQELELNGSDDFTGSGDSGAVDVSGLQTNIVATSQNIEDAFPGNDTTGPEPEVSRWGWMGSANSDSLSLETTDVKDVTTCDLHIWKITITL